MASENDTATVGKMIESFYQIANIPLPANLQVNERVSEIFGVMLSETQKCSEAFAWVPTPPSGRATISWLATQLGRGLFDHHRSRLSFTCARGVIRSWHRELEMASLGFASRSAPAWG